LPYDAAALALPAAASWRARLGLAFEHRDARTVLAARRVEGPLAVQKVLHPEGAATCHAIVLHPPGGIAGGDDLAIDVEVGRAAHVVLTTPGAAKWYRSRGPWATQRVAIEVGAQASVEWLPQESIFFDAARADAALELRLAADARAIAWDVACLGHSGSDEAFARGELRTQASLARAGRLAWRERARVDPGDARLHRAAGLGGATVFGTMIVAAPHVEDVWLALARGCAPASGDGSCTRLPGVLLARYRGGSSEHARGYFTAIWRALREPVLGRNAVEPRIWRT
jgi:urease accessory protein